MIWRSAAPQREGNARNAFFSVPGRLRQHFAKAEFGIHSHHQTQNRAPGTIDQDANETTRTRGFFIRRTATSVDRSGGVTGAEEFHLRPHLFSGFWETRYLDGADVVDYR